jgi:DNA helicase-2/ATP-dependent DNA helicase PcrA
MKELSTTQAEAVTHGEGPLVIEAAAGSGKTRVLTTRVVFLVAVGLALPEEIVVITFTNTAADECAMRIQRALGPQSTTGMTICTFHAWCGRILRRHAPALGRTNAYTIYEPKEVKKLIDYLMADEERTTVQTEVSQFGKVAAEEIANEISLAKNRLWTPDFYAANSSNPVAPLVSAVWREYEAEARLNDAVDFDDLPVGLVTLLGTHAPLLLELRRHKKWVLVDEVQDFNYVQWGLIRLICEPEGNFTGVGDFNQSLFGWRGADPASILTFAQTFPRHRRIQLTENWRSHSEILEAADRLIAHNTTGPKLKFDPKLGPGGHISSHRFEDEHEEARWIAGEIARQLRAGVPASEIMVIARTASATDPVQHALAQANIKHRVAGSMGLYERPEVKDALAYLSLLVNPNDGHVFRRAVSRPRRGVGDATAKAVINFAREQGIDLLTACTRADQLAGVKVKTRERLALFGQEMLRVKDEHQHRSIGHTVRAVLTIRDGLVQHYKRTRDTTREHDERRDAERIIEELRSVCRSASAYDAENPSLGSLLGFIEQAVGLHSAEVTSKDELVTVATIHKAKGGEALLVFICGFEEGLMPLARALEEGGVKALEEERRGGYVAITRGKKVVLVTWAARRHGQLTNGVSRFRDEAGIPEAA